MELLRQEKETDMTDETNKMNTLIAENDDLSAEEIESNDGGLSSIALFCMFFVCCAVVLSILILLLWMWIWLSLADKLKQPDA